MNVCQKLELTVFCVFFWLTLHSFSDQPYDAAKDMFDVLS